MRRLPFIFVFATLALAGCTAHDNREWMKVDRSYTKQEFQRDYRECTRDDKIDDACMREKGWVAVNPSKQEGPRSVDPLPARRGRY